MIKTITNYLLIIPTFDLDIEREEDEMISSLLVPMKPEDHKRCLAENEKLKTTSMEIEEPELLTSDEE